MSERSLKFRTQPSDLGGADWLTEFKICSRPYFTVVRGLESFVGTHAEAAGVMRFFSANELRSLRWKQFCGRGTYGLDIAIVLSPWTQPSNSPTKVFQVLPCKFYESESC